MEVGLVDAIEGLECNSAVRALFFTRLAGSETDVNAIECFDLRFRVDSGCRCNETSFPPSPCVRDSDGGRLSRLGHARKRSRVVRASDGSA